jgi:predicted phage tail protein
MLRNIKLYGSLAIDTGVDSLPMDVNHSAMLFSGLKSTVPGFRKATQHFKEIVVVGTRQNAEQMEVVQTTNLLEPFGDCDTIHVMPSTEGDISWAVAAAYAAIAAEVGSVAAVAIIAVAAVGLMYGLMKLAQALAPKPSTGSGQSDNSFIFSGPHNTANQGGPVPIIYGTALVGSTIIASNYITVDVPVGTIANTYIPGDFE